MASCAGSEPLSGAIELRAMLLKVGVCRIVSFTDTFLQLFVKEV